MANEYSMSITLGDGTVLEGSHCSYAERDLWCFIKDKDMGECYQIFSDSEKTAVIQCHYASLDYRYTGFTELLMIRKAESTVNVRLTWPEGSPHSVEELEEPEDERDS